MLHLYEFLFYSITAQHIFYTNAHCMFDFHEKFKERSSIDLLRILDNPSAYQTNAVEAAKAIIEDRQLSHEMISDAKALFERERQAKADKLQSKKSISNYGLSTLQSINPLEAKPPEPTRIIGIICVLLAGLLFFKLYFNFRMMWLVLGDISYWDTYIVLFLLSLLYTPFALWLFYRKTSVGWVLIAALITYYVAISFEGFIVGLIMEFTQHEYLNVLFYQPSPWSSFLGLAFYIGVLFVVCKQKIRIIYRIGRQKMLSVLSLTAIVLVLSKAIGSLFD